MPNSHVPLTRNLDNPACQALEYDVQIIYRVDVEKDERILESSKFVIDDDFVKSKEFIYVLYNYICKMLRRSVQNITP